MLGEDSEGMVCPLLSSSAGGTALEQCSRVWPEPDPVPDAAVGKPAELSVPARGWSAGTNKSSFESSSDALCSSAELAQPGSGPSLSPSPAPSGEDIH